MPKQAMFSMKLEASLNMKITCPKRSRRRESLLTPVLDDPMAALRMDELFGVAAGDLAEFPERGREGIVLGTRELIPRNSYRTVYQIIEDTVWVLAIVHTSRLWP